jgi:hypothetical protein
MERLTPILMLLVIGCGEPEPTFIAKPGDRSLRDYVGTVVAVEGIALLDKVGDCLRTSGPTILVEGIIDWPPDYTKIRVIGTLRAATFPGEWPHFILERASWSPIDRASENAAR